jgi:hypothetical protein
MTCSSHVRTAVVCIALTGCYRSVEPPPDAGNPDETTLYYPTHVGDRLVYEKRLAGEVTEYAKVVTSAEPMEAGFRITLERVPAREDGLIDTVEVTAAGVFIRPRLPAGAGAVPVIKDPAVVGDSWSEPGDLNIKVTVGRVGEEVTVPAGTFQTVRLDWTMRLKSGRTDTISTWYARGVGMVKRYMHGQKVEDVEVLKAFEPGQK